MISTDLSYNRVINFQLGKLPVRGRLVMCDHVTQDIISRHEYPAFIARPLSEALVFSALMSSTLKNEGGIFTLQIQGKGPLSLLVVDVMQNGNMRGYARYKGDEKITNLRKLVGDAQMVLTLDDGSAKNRYQGVVEMLGSTLTEAMQHYFTQSEQSRTVLKLLSHDSGKASGLYLQWLPSDHEDEDEVRDQWIYVVSLLNSLKDDEFIAGKITPEQLLHRLFHDQELMIHSTMQLQAQCRCSRERISGFMHTLSADEQAEFIENNVITVKCEFCSATYVFTPEELKKG